MRTLSVGLVFMTLPVLFGQTETARSSGAAYFEAGRSYCMLSDYKKATEAFQKALAAEPSRSEYALWLGRSFARRAEISSPFSAPKYASRARGYFEKAVALDPRNEEALGALFDYYLEAPGFRGDGYHKAAAIAQRIAEQNPAEGRFAESRLVERRSQFDTAGEQLGHAIELAQREASRVLELARDLAKRGRTQREQAKKPIQPLLLDGEAPGA